MYGDDFTLTLLTNDPDLALAADRAGIDRIGVDIERIGKHHRQGNLNTWISDHDETDLPALRRVLRNARLFARCNPMHDGSADEIDRLLYRGVEVIMLPFFHGVSEVKLFLRLLDGRAEPVLLLETAAAAEVVGQLCNLEGVVEIHVGLNDLRLSLGWKSHFDVLVSDYLERICETILSAGHRLGVGGLGRSGDNDLPIPSDLVYGQYPRLGAKAALVSRSFFAGGAVINLEAEVSKLRDNLNRSGRLSDEDLERQRNLLRACL